MNLENLVNSAVKAQSATKGNNNCPPSEIATTLHGLIPDNLKPYFRAPRGVADEKGQYVGSIIQIAKGSLGRLHGPALELFTSHILSLLLGLDERTPEEAEENILVIVVDDKEIPWDVRRYSSSQDERGRWQSIPDFSLYLDCSQTQMREALKATTEEEPKEKATKDNTRRRRG